MLMPHPQFTLTSALRKDLRFHEMTHIGELNKHGSTHAAEPTYRLGAPKDLLGQAASVTARRPALL